MTFEKFLGMKSYSSHSTNTIQCRYSYKLVELIVYGHHAHTHNSHTQHYQQLFHVYTKSHLRHLNHEFHYKSFQSPHSFPSSFNIAIH